MATGDASKLRGKVDKLVGRNLLGWAYSSDAGSEPATVEVSIDGQAVGLFQAGHYREDLEKAGIGSGNHSFQIVLPAAYFDDRVHEIAVRHAGSSRQIASAVNSAKFSKEHSPNYILGFTKLENSRLYGYMYDRVDSAMVIDIELIHGDERVAVESANEEVGAESSLGPMPRPCGFSFDLTDRGIEALAREEISIEARPDGYRVQVPPALAKLAASIALRDHEGRSAIVIEATPAWNSSVKIDLYKDGEHLRTVDVARGSDGQSGALELPELRESEWDEVHARIAGSGVDIIGSPLTRKSVALALSQGHRRMGFETRSKSGDWVGVIRKKVR